MTVNDDNLPPSADELLAAIADTIRQGPSAKREWNDKLRLFLAACENDVPAMEKLLVLANDLAAVHPDAAADLLAKGVLGRHIKIVLSHTGHAAPQMVQPAATGTLREKAAKSLLALSAGEQLARPRAIFAAWAAAVNLDPED